MPKGEYVEVAELLTLTGGDTIMDKFVWSVADAFDNKLYELCKAGMWEEAQQFVKNSGFYITIENLKIATKEYERVKGIVNEQTPKGGDNTDVDNEALAQADGGVFKGQSDV